MTESTNRTGQALDLEALEKLLEPIIDSPHADECGARNEENDDDIDDNPLEFEAGCDCGVINAWKATEMIRAERARIRELEALAAPAVGPAIGVREKLEALASRMFEDNQTYWAGKVSDIAKTLPPNPKGREQEEGGKA